MNDRQKLLLKYIIDEYISTAQPVGSKLIISKYMKNISAATVRNEMAILEKKGYLEKNHTSSGRIPSNLAYKLYEKEFSESFIDENLKFKLKSIFDYRQKSIDTIISESCKLINETLNLPLVTLHVDKNVYLKRFDLIAINENSALMIVILSNGEISKNLIEVKEKGVLKDLSICIRIFNDRLVDCNINEVKDRLKLIEKLVREKIQSYEFIMREIVEKIFNFKEKITTNIVGTHSLVNIPEFNDHNKLKEVLSLLENTSIWEQIAKMSEIKNDGLTSITFGDELGQKDILFATTDIDIEKDSSTKLVMVAPTRIDYSRIKGLLDFIREEFEKILKQK